MELLLNLCNNCVGNIEIYPENLQHTHADESKQNSPAKNIKNEKEERCLCCYGELLSDEIYIHKKCSQFIFGSLVPPKIHIDENKIEELAIQSLHNGLSVTGVQKKLSLGISKSGKENRLTIMDFHEGNFILKPLDIQYKYMQENEHMVMLLANRLGFQTAKSTLIRTDRGNFAYLTKRFDRPNVGEKIAQEDFCQVLNKYSYEKYTGNMEQIGDAIKKHSCIPAYDIKTLFEITIFNFLCGNKDAHLKNFSFISPPEYKKNQVVMSPFYDLLSTEIHIEDEDDLAINLNGTKRNLKKDDFLMFAKYLKLGPKLFNIFLDKIHTSFPIITETVETSFLPDKYKKIFLENFSTRLARLR